MPEVNHDAVAQELLDAAKNYFIRFGYSRVSTDEIASSSGRSKKTLYKHFGAKDQLLQAVLESINGEAEKEILSILDRPSTSLDHLKQLLKAVSTTIISSQDTLFQDLRDKQPEIFLQARADRLDALFTVIGPHLDSLAEQGVIRNDMPFKNILTLFIDTVESQNSTLGLASQDPQIGKNVDLAIQILIDALARTGS